MFHGWRTSTPLAKLTSLPYTRLVLHARTAPRPPGYLGAECQRLFLDALCKSIVNRVDMGNIKHVVPVLFDENLSEVMEISRVVS